MRVQEHAMLSTVAACLALPLLKKDIWIPFTASIFIDADHYLWHAVTQRSLNLREAVRYFEQADPRQTRFTRLFHHPLFLGLLLFLAVRLRSRFLALVLSGLLFHVGFDVIHMAQLQRLKRALSKLAGQKCPACGQYAAQLQIHTLYIPHNLLDRYNRKHFTVLCPACHELAHAR